MRLLITGVSGLLGVNLAWEALQAGHQVIGATGSRPLWGAPFAVVQTDLTADGAVETLWEQTRPEAVIHTAALANLEACEQHPDIAQQLNAEVPGRLAALAAQQGVPMIHISTDAVFDGQRGNYSENDPPHPLSTYARTKWAGEQAVAEAYPQAIVARVNFFGWSLTGKRSLAEWFLDNLQDGRPMQGFTNVFFCPLLTNHLARLLLEALAKDLHGLYHFTSPACLSKFAFGIAIAKTFGYDHTLIRPSTVEEAGLAARRGHNLTLRNDKLTAALGRTLPTWEDGLVEFHSLYRRGYPAHIRRWVQAPHTHAR